MLSRPQVDLELRPVDAPSWATPGATVYVMLPALDVLVGEPGFGTVDPIALPANRSVFDARAFFSQTLH